MPKFSEFTAQSPAALTDKVVGLRSTTNSIVTVQDILKLSPVVVLGQSHTAQTKNDANTTATALYTLTIPAGTVGPNDAIRVWSKWALANNATNKTLTVKLGGQTLRNSVLTTVGSFQDVTVIGMRNSLSAQIGGLDSDVVVSSSGSSLLTGTVNMAVSQDLTLVAQWGTAGAGSNNITLSSVLVELLRVV